MQQINAAQNGGVGTNGIAAAVQARVQAIEDSSDAWLMADAVAADADTEFADEVEQNTSAVISASEARAEAAVSAAQTIVAAEADVTQVTQGAVNARIAAVEAETEAVVSAAATQTKAVVEAADAQAQAQSGSGQAFTGTRPTGLARSIFSLGFAAQGLGLSGLAQPAFAVGGLAQVVEEIPLFNNQIGQMASRLLSMDGVFGEVARAGGNVALALGLAGDGLGASLLAVGAVALPVVAAVGLIAAVLSQIEGNAQAAANALKAEADINAQIAAGATSSDLQKQIDDATNKQKGYQDTVKTGNQLVQNYQDAINKAYASQNYFGAGPSQAEKDQAAANAQAAEKALKDFFGTVPDAAGGMIAIQNALSGAQASADALTPQIVQLTVAQHSQGVAANDLAAAADADTQAILKEADFKRQIASESVQQLQQQLADTKSAQAAIASEMDNNPLLSDDARTKLGAQFFQLGVQITDIGNALANANVQQAVQGVLALNDAYAKIQEASARTSQDRNIQAADTLFDHLTSGIRSAQDQATQFAQQQADFALQSARAQQDFDTQRALEQRDFDQQTEQAATDHEARMSQITLDARQSILEDAQRLDARAVYNDEQRRDRQLADETTSYNQQTEQRAAAFAQQLQDQQDQFNLQRDRAQQDFALQNSRQAAQYALQQSRQQEDWATQNQRQQAQYALQDFRQAQDNATQLAALSTHYNLMDFTQSYWLNRLQEGWSAFFQGLPLPPSIQPISGQYTSGASQYAANAARGVTVNGGIHIHGDFSGTTDDQKAAIVEQGLRAFFGQGLVGNPG